MRGIISIVSKQALSKALGCTHRSALSIVLKATTSQHELLHEILRVKALTNSSLAPPCGQNKKHSMTSTKSTVLQ